MRKEQHMKRKIMASLMAVSLLAGAMTACSGDAAKESEESVTEGSSAVESVASETEASASDVVDEGSDIYPLSYTDPYGNQVVIESEPQKIVSVSPALTEIVFALGAQDKLVGRSDYDDYPAEAMDIQSVGPIDLPDTELIASLEPDLVIASSIFSEEAYNALTALDIPVAIIIDEDNLDGMIDVVGNVADLIGAHDEGVALTAELTDELAALEGGETSDLTVYYCMGFGEYGDFTAGGDTFINDIIEAGGAVNAAGDISGWSYSVEQLLEKDPDIILVPAWGYDLFVTSEPYTELTAVQEGRVISVDNNIFERQTPRNIEAVQIIRDAVDQFAASSDVQAAA